MSTTPFRADTLLATAAGLLIGAAAAHLFTARFAKPQRRPALGDMGFEASTEAIGLQRLREAEQLRRAKGELLSKLGHELRNPLNAIVTSVEVLRLASPNDAIVSSARAVLARQTRQLLTVMDRVLDVDHSGQGPGASRVGLIDEDPDAVAAVRSILELAGHSVCTATDGAAFLALLLTDPPDVAIVDIGMSSVDGYELARCSRAGGYRGRLIALSCCAQPSDQQRSLTEGFEAHLVKPVDPQQLLPLLAHD